MEGDVLPRRVPASREEAEKLEMDDEDDCLEYPGGDRGNVFRTPAGAESDRHGCDASHLADGHLTERWFISTEPCRARWGAPVHGKRRIMSLKDPSEVRDIAAALSEITEAEFRRRYFQIDAKGYGFPLSEEDFAYTWSGFKVCDLMQERKAGMCFSL
jgi:hypothetical protein